MLQCEFIINTCVIQNHLRVVFWLLVLPQSYMPTFGFGHISLRQYVMMFKTIEIKFGLFRKEKGAWRNWRKNFRSEKTMEANLYNFIHQVFRNAGGL